MIDRAVTASGITPLTDQPTEVEITKRVTTDGQPLYFVLNMSNDQHELPLKFRGYRDLLTDQTARPTLNGWDVEILTK